MTVTIKRSDLKDRKAINLMLAAGFTLQVAR
jgi:hypothetical protein